MPNNRKLREEQEGPCGWLTRLVRRWRWARRQRDIIQTCGCVTYCPKCHDMLNDQAYWLASNGDGLGTYKCRLCGNVSEWHFGIAPVAVLIHSAHTNDTANVSDQIPRTRGVANTTDSPERLSASVLFAPCDGCANLQTCKTIGCIAKELEETI